MAFRKREREYPDTFTSACTYSDTSTSASTYSDTGTGRSLPLEELSEQKMPEELYFRAGLEQDGVTVPVVQAQLVALFTRHNVQHAENREHEMLVIGLQT